MGLIGFSKIARTSIPKAKAFGLKIMAYDPYLPQNEKEPPVPDNPLLKLDSVIITPHDGSYSETSYWQLRRHPVNEVARVLQGKWPIYCINPQVKEKFIQRWGLEMT